MATHEQEFFRRLLETYQQTGLSYAQAAQAAHRAMQSHPQVLRTASESSASINLGSEGNVGDLAKSSSASAAAAAVGRLSDALGDVTPKEKRQFMEQWTGAEPESPPDTGTSPLEQETVPIAHDQTPVTGSTPVEPERCARRPSQRRPTSPEELAHAAACHASRPSRGPRMPAPPAPFAILVPPWAMPSGPWAGLWEAPSAWRPAESWAPCWGAAK